MFGVVMRSAAGRTCNHFSPKSCGGLLNRSWISYKVLTPENIDESVEVVARSFMHEPAMAFIQPNEEIRYRQWVDLGKIFAGECCSNGLSIGAFDEESNRLAGVFWNNDFAIEPEEGEMEAVVARSPDIHKLLQVLDSLVSKYCELRGPPQLGQTMVLWQLAVHPEFCRLGIANELSKRSVEMAQEKGFKRCISETTGDFSFRSLSARGMEEVLRQDYDKAKVEDLNGEVMQPWLGLDSVHNAMRVLEREF